MFQTIKQLHDDGYTIFSGRQLAAAGMYVSNDRTRPMLACVCLETTGGVTRAIATDSYRMGIFNMTNVMGKGATNPDGTILLDWFAIKQSKLLTNKPAENRICAARVKDDRVEFIAGKWDGKLLDYPSATMLDYPKAANGGGWVNWRNLMNPDADNGLTRYCKKNNGLGPLMNGDFLNDVAASFCLFADGMTIEMFHADAMQPMCFHGKPTANPTKYGRETEAFALLMPVRR